jgi:hypothetical protein
MRSRTGKGFGKKWLGDPVLFLPYPVLGWKIDLNQCFTPIGDLIFEKSLQEPGAIGIGEGHAELMELGGGDGEFSPRELGERRFGDPGFGNELLLGDPPFLDTTL